MKKKDYFSQKESGSELCRLKDIYCSEDFIKAHVSLDEATLIPDIANISETKRSDRRGVDNFYYPKDTIVVDDRGYFDYKLLKSGQKTKICLLYA